MDATFCVLVSIYIQDETNSDNYAKYDVASVVLTPNSYITLTVTYLSGGGSGATNFGNTYLIMSVFTNDIEVDGRLTTLRLKRKVKHPHQVNKHHHVLFLGV